MLRFVTAPDGSIVPDLAEKLPGRGVWVTASRQSVEEAVRRNVFAKSLKQQAKPARELADLVDRLLEARCRQSLSFANKAGLVVSGFMKVDAALETGKVVALVQASDAAEDGAARLLRKFRAIAAANGRTAAHACFLRSAELSLAIARPNVIHAGLLDGGQSRAFLTEGLRLLRYRLNDTTLAWATLCDAPAQMAGVASDDQGASRSIAADEAALTKTSTDEA